MKKILYTILLSPFFLFGFSAKAETCPLVLEKAYKSSTASTVFYITRNCAKRAFNNSTVFFTYFKSWGDVIITSNAILKKIPGDSPNFMPFGPLYDPKYGALVKVTNDPKVYLLLNDKKYWITSDAVFNKLGYAWKWIEDIDERLLDKYAVGEEINYTDHHPNYTLVKYPDSTKIYRVAPDENNPKAQVKEYIPDEKTFLSLGYRWDRIVLIKSTETYLDKGSSQSLIEPHVIPETTTAPIQPVEPIKPVSYADNDFLLCPNETDITSFNRDFDIQFKGDVWKDNSYICDISSAKPSRLSAYNTLKLAKNIQFSKVLPFTNNQSLYDYISLKNLPNKQNSTGKLALEFATECDQYSYGGRSVNENKKEVLNVHFNGNFTRLYPTISSTKNCDSVLLDSTANNPDLMNNFVYNPVYKLSLLTHEAHHAISNKWHELNGNDSAIDDMGSWAVQFYINAWIYLYADNISPNTKNLAKQSATQILRSRFTNDKCPTSTELKEVVNNIAQGSCR